MKWGWSLRASRRSILADGGDPGQVHHVIGERVFGQKRTERFGVKGAVHLLVQACAHRRIVAVADGLKQQVAQGAAGKVQLAQNVKDPAAQGLALLIELVQKPLEDLTLPGLAGNQVPEMAHLGLADTVDAAKTLFHF